MNVDLIAYIVLHGRSSWASLNTYYSVLKKASSRPDLVWVCTESIYEDELARLIEGIKIISAGFDFTPKTRTTVLPEGDIVEAGMEIGGLPHPYIVCLGSCARAFIYLRLSPLPLLPLQKFHPQHHILHPFVS